MDALAGSSPRILLDRAALVLGGGQVVYQVAPVVIPPTPRIVEGTFVPVLGGDGTTGKLRGP